MIKKINKRLSILKLKSLLYPSGLFAASSKNVKTGYNKAWLRDNIYETLGLFQIRDIKTLKKTFSALFDILLKHEYKIDWAIKEKPDEKYKYIHARYCPLTLDEIHEDWGNKQNDAVGAFLFKVGHLYKNGIMVFRDENDVRILQKLVYYLDSIEYWHDKDNGIWEENEEIHASSVGACVAGLREIRKIVDVSPGLIENGQMALNDMLPRESHTKEVDLALLSLIYPYKVVCDKQARQILNNVEQKLARERGVIRYIDDQYYNNGMEAEWCFGFPWLAKIFSELGDREKHEYYMKKTHSIMNWKGDLPELYFAKTGKHNENTPLGWSQAMYLCAVIE